MVLDSNHVIFDKDDTCIGNLRLFFIFLEKLLYLSQTVNVALIWNIDLFQIDVINKFTTTKAHR